MVRESWVITAKRAGNGKARLTIRHFENRRAKGPGDEIDLNRKPQVTACSVAVLSCVADMSNTFRLITCVVVSTNENAF